MAGAIKADELLALLNCIISLLKPVSKPRLDQNHGLRFLGMLYQEFSEGRKYSKVASLPFEILVALQNGYEPVVPYPVSTNREF